MERQGAVRVRDQYGREVNFGSWGEEPPRSAPAGGKSRGGGGKKQGKKAGYFPGCDVFRCAACNIECSGEVSFSQHCQGKSHATRSGHYGFAGLMPNSYGIVPPLTDTFMRDNAPRELSAGPAAPLPSGKKEKGKEMAVQKVSMSIQNEEAVRAALHRSASAGSLANAANGGLAGAAGGDGSPAAFVPKLGPAMHKCLSESRLGPPHQNMEMGGRNEKGKKGKKGKQQGRGQQGQQGRWTQPPPPPPPPQTQYQQFAQQPPLNVQLGSPGPMMPHQGGPPPGLLPFQGGPFSPQHAGLQPQHLQAPPQPMLQMPTPPASQQPAVMMGMPFGHEQQIAMAMSQMNMGSIAPGPPGTLGHIGGPPPGLMQSPNSSLHQGLLDLGGLPIGQSPPPKPPAAAPYRPPIARNPGRSSGSLVQSSPAETQLQDPPQVAADTNQPPATAASSAVSSGTGRRAGKSGSRMTLPTKPPPALEELGPMTSLRKNLPAASYRDEIIRLLQENQVLVVEGETGCGKTTQVPQFVLEDAAKKGIPANIICTQPRRISAMGVAERVATERGEPIGSTVGYTIRLESKVSSSTHLLFCTTGILLRRLEEDPDLKGVTHIFVDEVHERSIESDFLLMVLRDMLRRNKSLRLCLMSATLDVDMFGRYFDGAPSVSIPGRTFPVATMWLEDALQITRHVVNPRADWVKRSDADKKAARRARYMPGGYNSRFPSPGGPGQQPMQNNRFAPDVGNDYDNPGSMMGPSSFFAGGMMIPGQGMGMMRQNLPAAPSEDVDDEELTPEELRGRYPRYDPGVHSALSQLDHNAINYELIVQILQWLLQCGGPQAAADWARRQHGTSPEKKLEPAALDSGAADRAWDDDEGDSNVLSKSPDVPDDWETAEPLQVSMSPPSSKAPAVPEPVAAEGPADAVLVFLPGLKEIQALQEAMMALPEFAREPQRSWVLPLHSTVPPEEQRLVFVRPPPGVHKIVLATNIAETAITIDDIGFVIDTGRMKENRYDPLRRMASLEDVLESRANARQRRGRAGRVRPGAAIHLVTSHRHNVVATTQQAPEVQRVPLEQLVLRIKALQYPGTAAQVCSNLLEPPAPAAVEHAVSELVRIEALDVGDGKEELTSLGIHLSTLPVDVRIGKLLLLGAIFGVTDECLTIAATLSCRSPFLSPLDRREEADMAKQQFNRWQSDHLSTLAAYNEWDSLGSQRRFAWARSNFLGVKTLQMIASLKRQLLEHLSEAGFVRSGLRSKAVESMGRIDGSDGCRLALVEGVGRGRGHQGGMGNGNGSPDRGMMLPMGPRMGQRPEMNAGLLKALLCAALYPQVMTVEYPKPKPGKIVKPESLKFRIREEGHDTPTEVALHPSSINSKCTRFESSYLVYHERVKTTRMYVRDCTPVTPYALMLFGGDLTAEGGKLVPGAVKGKGRNRHQQMVMTDSVLCVDGWIKFSVPYSIQTLLLAVRESLDELLKNKIENPDVDLGGHEDVINAVVQLISTQA